jgi:hypothetical protein
MQEMQRKSRGIGTDGENINTKENTETVGFY